MTKHLKLMILVSWKEEGKWDLYPALKERLKRLEIRQPFFLEWTKALCLQKLSVQLSLLYVPFLALTRRQQFDIVLSWPMTMGICYGILNRFLRFHPSPKHILRDFHINLIRKDWVYRLKLLMLKLALPGIDYFLTTSRQEETIYAKMFNISPDKIRFFPDAPPNHFFHNYSYPREDYIFAYGNSDRDFDTLIEAVQNVKEKMIILSQGYKPPKPLPDHVKIINARIGEPELIKLIVSARLVVLPLDDYSISAGQLGMMEAMGLGRPLIVTSNMATEEYARHGKTALFFEAQNTNELKRHILFLWEQPVVAETMGRQAREISRTYPGRVTSVLFDVFEAVLLPEID